MHRHDDGGGRGGPIEEVLGVVNGHAEMASNLSSERIGVPMVHQELGDLMRPIPLRTELRQKGAMAYREIQVPPSRAQTCAAIHGAQQLQSREVDASRS